MRRARALGAFLLVALAIAGASGPAAAAARDGTAIRVDGTTISTARFVGELRIIAANHRLARALKQADGTTLVPRRGTIDPLLSQAWANSLVNQVLADREFRRRHLHVSRKLRAGARKYAAKLFRGLAVLDAFPHSFQRLVVDRQARQDALLASFPKDYEPTAGDLDQLYAQVVRTCRGGKLIAMIFVDTRAQAGALSAQLGAGADFATLAREHSTDSEAAPRGGVTMCIGSPRFVSSEPSIQQAAQATPIGGVTAPVKTGDGYAILRILPLTLDNARSLLAADWHRQHPTPLYDFLTAQRAVSRITVAKRFALAAPSPSGLTIGPVNEPVRL